MIAFARRAWNAARGRFRSPRVEQRFDLLGRVEVDGATLRFGQLAPPATGRVLGDPFVLDREAEEDVDRLVERRRARRSPGAAAAVELRLAPLGRPPNRLGCGDLLRAVGSHCLDVDLGER
jgi:hypothetical protein